MDTIIQGFILTLVFGLYLLLPKRRRYLKNRVGTKSAIRNIYQFGRNLSFMIRKKDLDIRGDTKPLSNGAILYSFHFGVWELMPHKLSQLGYRLGILVNDYKKQGFWGNLLNHLLRKFRTGKGIRIFYPDDVFKIVRFIKSGGIFGVLVDGNTFYAKFEKVRKLASLCNVPLIPFAAYQRCNKGILEIGVDLKQLVMRYPYHYLWFYKSRR